MQLLVFLVYVSNMARNVQQDLIFCIIRLRDIYSIPSYLTYLQFTIRLLIHSHVSNLVYSHNGPGDSDMIGIVELTDEPYI